MSGMAAPQDGALQAAMGLVKEAIRLDSLEKTQDAYIQYLESVAYISQGLLTEAKGHTGPANVKNTKRLLQLAQQCIERASTVTDRMQESQSLQQSGMGPAEGSPGPTAPGNHSMQATAVMGASAAPGYQSLPPATSGYQSSPPTAPGNQSLPPAAPGNQSLPPVTHGNQFIPPASGAARTAPFQGNLRSTLPTSPASSRRMPPSPLQKAYQDNQKLMAAYQARMTRLRGRRDKGQLNLSLQRRMIENMAIARAKQEALKRKMEERHRQYQEEAARQFTSVDGLPLPEDQCQELYAQIKEFEDQELWLKAWRAKLAEHSEDLKLIEDLVKQILSCQEHPITKKMQQFQLKLYDRLHPLVEKLQQEPEKVTVPYIEDLTDLEHYGSRSTEQLSSSQEEDSLNAVVEDKSDTDEGPTQSERKTSEEGPGDIASTGEQSSLYEQNASDQALESSDETVDKTGTEGPGDFSDTVRSVQDDVKSAIQKGEELVSKLKAQSNTPRRDSEDDLAYLQNNMDDMFEDLTEECEDEPGNKTDHDQSQEEDGETGTEKQEGEKEEEEVEKMTEDAVQKHLVQVVKDIREFMDHVLAMLIVGYRELNSVAGRDQCLATMEEPFFSPVWSCVGALFRRADHKKEVVLARAMTRYSHALPEELGVPERLCAASVEGTALYKPAVNELRRVTSCNSPISKLECIVRTCRAVCECADHDTSEGAAQKTAASIGADDLLPLLSYVILQSELPQLMSECHSMEVFIREGYLLGEEGYCLTTLQTALDYVASLAKS
ncbi:PREDICTED: VPS9 domain-containing protein 1-like [Branchiostoma belcheri]|uniref:VPS9 domain-containing protein 1-like n=1 Tax=Branchiostoma belcheri TaxID=7741 RepID=A0A6P4ZTJ8_BRABE|nr:PREDICTED: VPS9 domain-containing protein 1-like [Branchiostoma belcheri]